MNSEQMERLRKALRNIEARTSYDILMEISSYDLRALIDERDQLVAELSEQARLNGMGSEREARLMARVTELEKDAERYRWLKTWDKTDGFSDDAIDREIAIDAAIMAGN